MIAMTLSLPRQTLIAAGAFVGLLLATFAWGISSIFINANLQNEFETKSRIMDSLRVQPVVSRNVGADRFTAAEVVIAAPTDTLAASELHKKVLASVEEEGGLVHSIQAEVTNEVTADGLRRISTQVTFDGAMETVQKALFALESSVPFVFVDSIALQPAPTSASGSNVGERLRVSLVVSSYWKTLDVPTRR
jgi:hypothetical protein